MLWLFVATIAVIGGAWFISSRMHMTTHLDRLLATGIIALAAHITILLVAGVLLSSLNRTMVFALSLAWLVASWLMADGSPTPRQPSAGPSARSPAMTLLLMTIALSCIVSLTLIGIGCWVLPPFAWDEIWYHLTPMATWYQEEAIRQLPEAVLWQGYDPVVVDPNQLALDFSHAYAWANVYPLNAELSALWTMVLAQSDLISETAQLPYVLLGAMATSGLGRLVGAGRQGATTIALLFLLTPTVLIHLRVAYVDAAFGAMVTTSLYLLLRWQKQRSRGYALLFGLAVGLMAGIKSTGLAFAVIYLLAALVHGLWQVRRTTLTGKELFWQALIAGMAAIGVGAFWYLRTWWYYGNPIYPIEISFLGVTLPGIGSVNDLFMRHNTPPTYLGRSPILNLLTSWLELGDESYNYYSRTRGLGPAWGAVALPALVPFAAASWRGRHSEWLWMLALTAVLLAVQPAAWWPRYVLYVVPVGLAAMAWLLERLPRWGQTMAMGLLVVNLVASTSLVLVETLDKLPISLTLQREQRTFGQLYFDDYAWVDKIPPSQIGHTPMAWTYPLYGGLRHHVTLVDGATLALWRQAITASGVDYVAVNTRFGDHLAWAMQLTDLLIPFWEGDQLNVYRVAR